MARARLHATAALERGAAVVVRVVPVVAGQMIFGNLVLVLLSPLRRYYDADIVPWILARDVHPVKMEVRRVQFPGRLRGISAWQARLRRDPRLRGTSRPRSASTKYPRGNRGVAAIRPRPIRAATYVPRARVVKAEQVVDERELDLVARLPKSTELSAPPRHSSPRTIQVMAAVSLRLHGLAAIRLREISTSQPRRRRESFPRNIHVSAAASPRLVSTKRPRRSAAASPRLVSAKHPRLSAAASPRLVSTKHPRLSAAASPRLVSADYPRHCRRVAATRLHETSTSRPRRRRDSFDGIFTSLSRGVAATRLPGLSARRRCRTRRGPPSAPL